MSSSSWKLKFASVFFIMALVFAMLPATPTHAASVVAASRRASLEEFAASLKKSDSSQLVGVYVANNLAVAVIQQPSGNAGYVSSRSNTLTQFSLATKYGSIGLLAHNYLSGGSFSKIGVGTEIALVYGDGSVKKYQVNSVKKFQALSPTDPYSNFISLDNPDKTLSSTDLFNQTYGDGGLVLQTCISKDGNPSWGRLFIMASPAS
jgi:hypothetical protein